MPKTIQRMKSVERKKEILQKALEIIYNKGYYNLTVRSIADEIGISEAALYRHFNNKEEIINSLADMVFTTDRMWIDKTTEGTPFSRLEEIMRLHLQVLQSNPYLTAIVFQEEIFREYPLIRQKFNKSRSRKIIRIAEIVKSGQKKGVVAEDVDGEVFALIFLGSIRMTVLEWLYGGFSFSPAEKAEAITKELMKILKKEQIAFDSNNN